MESNDGRRRTRVIVSLLAAVAVLCPNGQIQAAPGPQARTVDGRVDDWHGSSSRLGGTWQYSRGEFVYQDHIFDDLGAETRQRSQQQGSTGPSKGDYRYPTDEERYGHNAADLLELRLAADAESLWLLARMNTLKVSDGTVIAIGLDSDKDAATGGGPWPYAAALDVDGVDRVITLWGTGGTITDLKDSSQVAIDDVAANTSNDNNAIEARIPRSMIGSASAVRLWAATGLWDRSSAQWMAVPMGSPSATAPGGGSPLVAARAFNVAFRSDETGSFMEVRQADALAAADISAFHADVDLDALTGGANDPYRIEPGHLYVVVMDQNLTIPPHHEGLSYDGVPGRFGGAGGALSQSFDFYGRHQPYAIYVPSTYDGTTPMAAALVLHGHGGSHSTYNTQPGFLSDMGEGNGTSEQPPMFLITPLARGSSFYADWGEADTLAVLDDVFRRFRIDEQRLYLTGYSMGGYGVYRLASLYPDRFAAAAVWAGYTGEFVGAYLTNPLSGGGRSGRANIGDPVDTLENLRHLPLVHLAGSNDEVVPTTGQYAAPRRLAELGYRSRFDLYPGYEHLTFALVDDWKQARGWLGNSRREVSPREINYKFSDGWTAPGLAAELGLVHGNAWWLGDLAMREPTEDALELASVTATSHAVPARDVTVARSTDLADSPTPHVQQLVSWDETDPLPVENRLELYMSGVGNARVDTAGARLQPCGLSVALATDGPATVRLAGRFPSGSTIVGDPSVTATRERSGLVLTVQSEMNGNLSVHCRPGR